MPGKETFQAKIGLIGVNPYVLLPQKVLKSIFEQAGKSAGPIPVKGKLNGHAFIQTLVKYSGQWRLYLNTPMRDAAQLSVGDTGIFELVYDAKPRTLTIHPKLEAALNKSITAKNAFEKLAPHYQKEIIRYINNLKTNESVERNVQRALKHLLGNERFVGRNPIPKIN